MPKKYRRRRRRKIRPPMDYVKVKLQLSSFLILRQNNGNVASHINVRNLGLHYLPDGNVQSTHEPLENYAKWQDLYDRYRVQYIKVRYRPLINQSTFDDASLANEALPGLFVAFDPDNGGQVNEVRSINALRGCRRFDLKKPFTFSMKIPKYSDNDNPMGWQNMQGTTANFTGTLQMLSDGQIATPTSNIPIGTITIETIVEMKGRQDSNPRSYFGVDKMGKTLTVYPTIKPNNTYYLESLGDAKDKYEEFNN